MHPSELGTATRSDRTRLDEGAPASMKGAGPAPGSRYATPQGMVPDPREVPGQSDEGPAVARRLFATNATKVESSESQEGGRRDEDLATINRHHVVTVANMQHVGGGMSASELGGRRTGGED